MTKFSVIQNTHHLGQGCIASILGGYDSPDMNRLVVIVHYPTIQEIQYGDYPHRYDNVPELGTLTFNN